MKEETISPETFIYFFVNSDQNITQTQMLSLKLTRNLTQIQTPTHTLILALKKVNEKCADEHFSFSFYSL